MTERSTQDLPCPFCGHSDSFVERMAFTSAYVICNACGAHGPISEQDGDGEALPGEEAALRAWNNRAVGENAQKDAK